MNKFSYNGCCAICGFVGIFEKKSPSFREGYQCTTCKASLRYQGQAYALKRMFSSDENISLSKLSLNEKFNHLKIYEPGVIGPFRELFSGFDNYQNSFYWDDVKLGEKKDGVECQSLESLTYKNESFDLVISSDIMEHVRHPWVAFAEILRVLKSGGYHIFSIPLHLPMRSVTKYRVDTSTEEDKYIDEPHYHGNGIGGKSLVYTDFGADIVNKLVDLGYEVTCDTIPSDHFEIKKLVTFITKKPSVDE